MISCTFGTCLGSLGVQLNTWSLDVYICGVLPGQTEYRTVLMYCTADNKLYFSEFNKKKVQVTC